MLSASREYVGKRGMLLIKTNYSEARNTGIGRLRCCRRLVEEMIIEVRKGSQFENGDAAPRVVQPHDNDIGRDF